ncbi:MAG: type II toxin-antitoxin system RelE/ParE family toxin [Candidatus Binatia bacterium]
MSLRIVFRVSAQVEVEKAATWYNDQREGLGEEFLQEIEDVVSRAAARPQRYPIVTENVRRAVARRFPYSVFFRTRSDTLVVLAVFHGRRNPEIWRRRI